MPTAALGAVAPGDVGRASGVSNTMQRFGGAFGIALASAIFAAHGHLGSAASFTAGYRPAMLGAVALSAAGSVAVDRDRPAASRCRGGLRLPTETEGGAVPVSAAPVRNAAIGEPPQWAHVSGGLQFVA